jgi:hypothetical protein
MIEIGGRGQFHSETWVTVIGKEVALPWKDLSPVHQRKAFIDEYLKHRDSVSELCRRFAVAERPPTHRFSG